MLVLVVLLLLSRGANLFVIKALTFCNLEQAGNFVCELTKAPVCVQNACVWF